MPPHAPDDGAAQFLALLDLLPMDDPRDDIDTASLISRFPELASVRIEEHTVAGPHGPVPARSYLPGSGTGTGTGTGPGLVWVHGGAFVAGNLNMPESHWVSMELAARGIPVLALDYQKALRGVHHPVLSDEVLAGWLAAAGGLLGVPVERLHLGGASAGANLTAGVAGRLVAGSLPQPASLVLVYPVLHSTSPAAGPAAAEALRTLTPENQFTPEFMRALNENYVGDPSLLGDTVAFPANGDQRGLPPVLMINAEADDLRPSGEAYAVQLAEAGVPVVVDFEPGTVHGYLDHPGLPSAIVSIDRIAAWLRRPRP